MQPKTPKLESKPSFKNLIDLSKQKVKEPRKRTKSRTPQKVSSLSKRHNTHQNRNQVNTSTLSRNSFRQTQQRKSQNTRVSSPHAKSKNKKSPIFQKVSSQQQQAMKQIIQLKNRAIKLQQQHRKNEESFNDSFQSVQKNESTKLEEFNCVLEQFRVELSEKAAKITQMISDNDDIQSQIVQQREEMPKIPEYHPIIVPEIRAYEEIESRINKVEAMI